jgi:hypothetical protein
MRRFNRARRAIARPRVQSGVRYIPLREQKVLTRAGYTGLQIRSMNKWDGEFDRRQGY